MMKREPIAITGISALFPGSTDMAGFWNDILAGRDLLTDVPSHYWLVEDFYDPDPKAVDKTYGRRGGFLTPVPFDTVEFGMPPTALPATDSSQLLALLGAKRVLADAARGRKDYIRKDRVGIFLGVAAATSQAMHMASRLQRPAWVKGMREAGVAESIVQQACDLIAKNFAPWIESTFPGILGNVVSGRIANRFDLGGSNFTTDAACASSLAAVSVAMNDLYLGNSDMVVTGGVDALNDIQMFMCFSKTPALSASGDCRPFSKSADGTMLGEGLAMFALRRLSDAERDGDHIYAVIRGMGSSSDGLAKSVYAPRAAGQATALRRAYAAAGFQPDSVEMVEAHGTATKAGDQAEFEALREVFSESNPDVRQWCALGSVKSQIGHTKGAAGAAGLFKVAMALHHKVLPPTIKVDAPNPALALEKSPFYLNTESRPWVRHAETPRRASLSSFGFGGTNFHMALEEYTGPGNKPPRLNESAAELALISTADAPGAAKECRRLASLPVDVWRNTARQSQKAFATTAKVRLAIVATSAEDLQQKLTRAAAALESAPNKAIRDSEGLYYDPAPVTGPVALLFSGQGSQYVGMGAGLAMSFDGAREGWDAAERAFEGTSFSLRQVVYPPPAFDDATRQQQDESLRKTEVAQPALAAASLAQLAVLKSVGLKPDYLAGHSFGELVALHAAGCFSAADLLRMARQRGELMAEAHHGTMTAVSHPIDDLRSLLRNHPGPNGIVIANHNSPLQAVLSGEVAGIEAVERTLADRSISFRRLPVSGAFHSPLMAEFVEPFSRFLADVAVSAPSVPVFSNASASPYPSDPPSIRERMASNLTNPVLFSEELRGLWDAGARIFVEVGAGTVLRQLTTQCLKEKPHTAIALSQKGQNDVVSLFHALGQLAVAGVAIQFEALWPAFHAAAAEPAPKPSPSVVFIDGAGYNRPYPPKGGVAALPKPNPEPVSKPVPTPEPVASHVPAPVPVPAPAVAPAAPPVAAAVAYPSVFEQIQMQISEAQRASQAAILDALSITLRSMETIARDLGGVAAPSIPVTLPPPSYTWSQPAPAPAPVYAPPVPVAPAPVYVQAPAPPPPAPVPAPVVVAAPPPPAPAPVAAAPVAAAPVAAAPKAAGDDLGSTLLRIVADKTGYPPEVLTLDAELEAGLGIDSIKRVEIFSALQQQAPGLPEVTPATMGKLRTLRDILEFLGASTSEAAAEAAPAAPAAAGGGADFEQALLEVVADKTGYPAEILNLDANLEAGLGIDSIKRVEIFSALQQRLPSLPPFQSEDAGRLRTLRDILMFMSAGASVNPSEQRAALSAARPAASNLTRHEIRLVRSKACGLPVPALFTAGAVAVVDGGSGVGELLVARLRELGIAAAAVAAVPAGSQAAVYLGGLASLAGESEALQTSYDAFAVAQALARGKQPALLVTARKADGTLAPWTAGVDGLARTFAREWPTAAVKALSLAGFGKPEDCAAAIVQELLTGGATVDVTLQADGSRWTPFRHAGPAAEGKGHIGPQSVVVVTGGGRGVTASCLIELAKASRPKIAILGRTVLEDEPAACRDAKDEMSLKRVLATQAGGKPDFSRITKQVSNILAVREIRATLEALRKAGSACEYFVADVRDRASVAKALHGARERFGPITAIVHGSGVIADKLIADKTPEQFSLVFETKVGGLRALLAETAADPINTICFFSSAAAHFGNTGQCDYAAANEILNQVAKAEQARRGAGCIVKAMGWGPWDGGMVTAALASHFRARGAGLIPLDEGAQCFVTELSNVTGSPEVLVGGVGDAFVDDTPPSERTTTVLVNRKTYPFLDGHRIKEHAVVPVVLVNEWFTRAAEALRPGLQVARSTNLKVLRGVPLPAFDTTGHLLRIVAKVKGNEVQCELRSPEGTLHYSASLALEDRGPEGETPAAASAEMSGYEYNGNGLFHGPDFQVIGDLREITDSGATALLRSTQAMGWSGGPWKTDAAALDGALQMMLLWGLRKMGALPLPTRFGTFQRRNGIAPGVLRCEVKCRPVGTLGIVADAVLSAADGRVAYELRDIELHLTPGS